MFEELILRQFRNYSDLCLNFDPRVNIILGKNGQGKTNIIEAMNLLVTGDSFRFTENENFIQKNKAEAFLSTKIKMRELEYQIQMQILKSRKNHLLNQKKTNSTETSNLLQLVIFSPESLSAIKDAADQRRTLIDELLISTEKKSAALIRDFRKALRTRNKVLKDFTEGVSDLTQTEAILDSLNPFYFKLATELTCARLNALKQIAPDLNFAMQKISKNNLETSIVYEISGVSVIHFTHEDIHNLLLKRQNELHKAELSSGTSLVGPQKHDVKFLYQQNDSRFFCSQGQQRALILSFKMAQIVYHCRVHGVYPILMLDDVLSELDEDKRESLIQFLQEIKTQIFMTTTDLKITGDLASQNCRVIEIVEGQIR